MRYLLSHVCTHVQWCLYHVLYGVELVIDWIVVPCVVSVVSRIPRLTPLPRVVINDITSCMKAFEILQRKSVFRVIYKTAPLILEKIYRQELLLCMKEMGSLV